eukprot:TRINITY_DN8264_c0_g2_i4.p1 TRINITY_DN8264_c0_g2~~TRINITY_DN8264_c0_g2_i4.p1  ORF type:complete len:217 (-),score=11.49 TRINITY_DN8264_c0_g2_i4:35-685(-)
MRETYRSSIQSNNENHGAGLDSITSEESTELNKIEVSKTLSEIKISIVCYFLMFLFGFLMIKLELPYILIMVPFLLEDVLSFILNYRYLFFYKRAGEISRFYIREGENISLFAAKIIFVVWIETSFGFYLSVMMIPLSVYLLMRMFYFFVIRSKVECAAINDFIYVMCRSFIIVQESIIMLKLDKLISWEWKELFWIYWIVSVSYTHLTLPTIYSV